MKQKVFLLSFILIAHSLAAQAQLSTNPWLNANDEEEVAKVYEKRQKRYKGTVANYTPEESTVIDRSSAYIEVEEQQETDDSLIGKITGAVAPKKEKKLIANTSSNRKALAARQQAAAASAEAEEESTSGLSSLGLANPLGTLQKSLNLPKINATGLIQKFEKASGIDLKSIAKSLK